MTAVTRLPEAGAAHRAGRTGASVTPGGASAGTSGAPGARPAHAAAPRARLRTPVRPGRVDTGATTPAAAASLPAGSCRAGRAAARRAATTADRPAGPEGRRTTGEGA
ncbi:hypothetical protein [Streptomyces sp. NRRL S-237]|uniref:hypothetical protein n=1 Tax=Streptomyces sp. NRRL S-237 TaxID=1463895 RepID=UPI00131B1930|nr:hypothetical protein [Streptomyces sp. NRRL S-237]